MVREDPEYGKDNGINYDSPWGNLTSSEVRLIREKIQEKGYSIGDKGHIFTKGDRIVGYLGTNGFTENFFFSLVDRNNPVFKGHRDVLLDIIDKAISSGE